MLHQCTLYYATDISALSKEKVLPALTVVIATAVTVDSVTLSLMRSHVVAATFRCTMYRTVCYGI
jgi:hypothetical protein